MKKSGFLSSGHEHTPLLSGAKDAQATGNLKLRLEARTRAGKMAQWINMLAMQV